MAKQQPQASVFTKFLTGMNKTWSKTKEQSKKGYADVPPGRYLAQLKSVKLYMYEQDEERPDGTTVKVQVPGALGQFTVLQGDYAGESMPWFPKFDTEEHVMYFQRDLRRLAVDVDNLDATELDAELQRLTKEKPFVWIKRNKGSGSGIFTNIDKLATQEEVDQIGGGVEIEGGEEPADPAEPAEPVATGKGKTTTKKTTAPPAPVPARAGAVNPPQRPPKGGKVATAAAEPEEPEEVEVGGGGEPESADEPEPESADESEAAEQPLEAGDAVQFKLNKKPARGTVKRWDEAKEAWVVRDDNTGNNWFLKPEVLTRVE